MGTYGLANFSIFFAIVFSALLLGSVGSQEASAGNGPVVVHHTITTPNGGECSNIGTWNADTKTCTLTRDLVNETIDVDSNGVTIDGNDHSSTGPFTVTDPFEFVGFCGEYRGVQFVGISGGTVKDLEISGWRHGVELTDSDNILVQNVNSHNNCRDGVHIETGDSDNTITGGFFNDNASDGIDIEDDNGNTITNVVANGNNDNGIEVDRSTGTNMTGNTFNSNGEHGIDYENSDDGFIIGNTVSFNGVTEGDDGINLVSSDKNTVNDNEVIGNTDDGIELDFSNDNTFEDNEVNNNGDEGFQIDDSTGNVFTDNEADGNDSNGFDLSDSDDNKFTGNTANGNGFGDVEDCEDGFEIEAGAGDGSDINTFTSNTANNNCLDGFSLEENSDSNTFTFNTANSNGQNGFGLDNSNDNIFFCNIVNGNTADGFHLVGSDGNTLDGNTMTSNGKGLLMNGSSDSNRIINNNFISNAGPQIEDESSENFIDGNYFDNFDEFGEGCPDNNVDGVCDVSTSEAIPDPDDVVKGNTDAEALTKPHICDGNEPEPAMGGCLMYAGITIISDLPGIIGTVTPDVDGISIIGHILGEEGFEEGERVPITGIAFAPNGQLFATGFLPGFGPFIIEVNPDTGEGIEETARILVIEGEGLAPIIINDLAIDPLTGDIYGFALGMPFDESLYLIDITFDELFDGDIPAALATDVNMDSVFPDKFGTRGPVRTVGLAFGPDGTLFAVVGLTFGPFSDKVMLELTRDGEGGFELVRTMQIDGVFINGLGVCP